MSRTPVAPTAAPTRRGAARTAWLAAGGVLAVLFAVLALLVDARVGWLMDLDRSVADGFHGWAVRHGWAVDVGDVLAVVLGPWMFRVLVLAAVVALLRRGERRAAVWAVVTMVLGGALGSVLKEVIGRARPHFPDPVATVGDYSFPSGHTTNAMLGVGVLLLLALPLLPRRHHPLGWAVAAFVVVLTCLDRLVLGVHFLSDVVGGCLLSAAVVALTSAFLPPSHRSTT